MCLLLCPSLLFTTPWEVSVHLLHRWLNLRDHWPYKWQSQDSNPPFLIHPQVSTTQDMGSCPSFPELLWNPSSSGLGCTMYMSHAVPEISCISLLLLFGQNSIPSNNSLDVPTSERAGDSPSDAQALKRGLIPQVPLDDHHWKSASAKYEAQS